MAEPISCPSCGLLQKTAAQYCFDCGSKLAVQPNQNIALCKVCSGALIAGATFCGACGTPVLATHPKITKAKAKTRPRKNKKLISALVAAPFVLLVGAIVTFSILPSINPISNELPIEQRVFQNCQELRLYFRGGVSRETAFNAGGFLDSSWDVIPESYEINKELDFDRDGIACETQVTYYSDLSCETKNANRLLASTRVRELSRWLEQNLDSNRFPDRVTRHYEIRNEIAQIYANLVSVPAPPQSALWEEVLEKTKILVTDWSDLLKTGGYDSRPSKKPAIESIPETSGALTKTVELARERSGSLLPACN